MVPDMFPGAWEEVRRSRFILKVSVNDFLIFSKFFQYAENYCFVQNNYFLPNNNPVVPGEIHVRTQKEIGYYQW